MAYTITYPSYRFTALPTVTPPDPAAVAELQEAVERFKASKPNYDNPCVEIILPEKEPTMRPLFQFTTVKPNAEVIWNTLSSHDISATAGYTVDEIRFYMFVVLQLRTDFKSAKELCNNYESRTAELKTAVVDLFNLNTEQSLRHTRVPPADLPLWVEHMLYIPYYMLKQLGDINAGLWNTLFDRTGNYSGEEAEHLVADLKPISDSITAYKLWYYGNDIISEKYSDIFLIDEDLSPNTVHGKVELIQSLHELMHDYLDHTTDNDIFDYSNRIISRPFTLGVSNASQ
jgi:hypothetical protein